MPKIHILDNKTDKEITELEVSLDSSRSQPFSAWKFQIFYSLVRIYRIQPGMDHTLQMKVHSSENMDDVGIVYVEDNAIVTPVASNGRINVRLPAEAEKKLQECLQFERQRQEAIRSLNNVFSQLIEYGIFFEENDKFEFSGEHGTGNQINAFAKRRMLGELKGAVKVICPTVNCLEEASNFSRMKGGDPKSEQEDTVLRLTAHDGSDLNGHLNFEQLFDYFVKKKDPESKCRLEDVKITEERARQKDLEKKRLAEREERREKNKPIKLPLLNQAIRENAALALKMLDDDDMPVDGMIRIPADEPYRAQHFYDSASAPLMWALCPQVKTTESQRAQITRKLIANGADVLMLVHSRPEWSPCRLFDPKSMIFPLDEPRAVLLAAYFTRRAKGNELKPYIRNELGLAIPSLPQDATDGKGIRGIIADYLPSVKFNFDLMQIVFCLYRVEREVFSALEVSAKEGMSQEERLQHSQGKHLVDIQLSKEDLALRELGRASLEYLQGKPQAEIQISNKTLTFFGRLPAPATAGEGSSCEAKTRSEATQSLFNFRNSSGGQNQDQRKTIDKPLTFGYQAGLRSFARAIATTTVTTRAAAADAVAAPPSAQAVLNASASTDTSANARADTNAYAASSCSLS